MAPDVSRVARPQLPQTVVTADDPSRSLGVQGTSSPVGRPNRRKVWSMATSPPTLSTAVTGRPRALAMREDWKSEQGDWGRP